MTTPTPRTTPCLLPTTFIRQSIIWSVVSGCLWTIVGGAMCYFYFNPTPAVSNWAGADVVWCWWKDGTFWLFITRLMVWNEPMSETVFCNDMLIPWWKQAKETIGKASWLKLSDWSYFITDCGCFRVTFISVWKLKRLVGKKHLT